MSRADWFWAALLAFSCTMLGYSIRDTQVRYRTRAILVEAEQRGRDASEMAETKPDQALRKCDEVYGMIDAVDILYGLPRRPRSR